MTCIAAYFRFTNTNGQPRFVINLDAAEKIEHARRILRGEERTRIHVAGTIIKEEVYYNKGWSFHLASQSIEFFEVSAEVCDAPIQFVEDNLEDIGGSTLPGSYWCPWSSWLIDEVEIEGYERTPSSRK